MSTIPEPVSSYRARADRYRPTTAEDMRRAALDLWRSGLTIHDIAAALRIGVGGVRQLLREHAVCGE